jgi:hypothetical protein
MSFSRQRKVQLAFLPPDGEGYNDWPSDPE